MLSPCFCSGYLPSKRICWFIIKNIIVHKIPLIKKYSFFTQPRFFAAKQQKNLIGFYFFWIWSDFIFNHILIWHMRYRSCALFVFVRSLYLWRSMYIVPVQENTGICTLSVPQFWIYQISDVLYRLSRLHFISKCHQILGSCWESFINFHYQIW